ncbi:hypothetical protein HEK616_81280 (plasmid) [Streptomyces nigrescens]|uniref:Uncharacterized protein n=1 Tax=Streptomyces nigrescens TaxID=1920 RepID=A0ABM8A7E5_STRNI|nr:hypothetical protein HEK616_81280 [Streptomyces nigrescens]
MPDRRRGTARPAARGEPQLLHGTGLRRAPGQDGGEPADAEPQQTPAVEPGIRAGHGVNVTADQTRWPCFEAVGGNGRGRLPRPLSRKRSGAMERPTLSQQAGEREGS